MVAKFSFNAAEWIALFPAPVPAGAGPVPGCPPRARDAFAAVRGPLARDALLRGLRPLSRPLQLAAAAQLRIEPWARRANLRLLAMALFAFALFGAVWALDGGRFGRTQLIAGTVAALFAVGLPLIMATTAGYRKSVTVTHSGAGDASADLNRFSMAGAVRWAQLCGIGGGGEGGAEAGKLVQVPSLLVQHDPEDRLCPCALPGCAGGLPAAAGRVRIAEIVLRGVVGFIFISVAVGWTAMITLSREFWGVWWGALLGTFYIVTSLNYNLVNGIGRFATNAPLLRLSLRLHHRAMGLALGDLLARARRALDGSEQDALEGEEPYSQLHACLAEVWRNRHPYLGSYAVALPLAFALQSFVAIINIVAGSCIPAYPIGIMAYTVVLFLFDTTSLVVSNEQISEITDLYLDARREIRELLARADDPASAPAAARLAAHDALLSSYLEASRFMGRLLGYPIDFSAVRTFLLALFTVVIGLWSILRGSGIFITMDFACPINA
ncbi:hypothetical protein DFJ74DRAFT_734259 [Hyaloraphidium curvatum]|nr:hypothetical protein DFJ74DRAFT_734259 [Hyaloraphidium curvatum]